MQPDGLAPYPTPSRPSTDLPLLALAGIAILIVYLVIHNLSKLPPKVQAKVRKWLNFSIDHPEYVPSPEHYDQETRLTMPAYQTAHDAWVQTGLLQFGKTREGLFLSLLTKHVENWNQLNQSVPKDERLPLPADIRHTIPTNPQGTAFGLRNPDKIEGMVYHQTGGEGTLEQCATYYEHGGHNAHGRNYQYIPYTLGVRKDGQICLLNDFALKTWSHGTNKRKGDENRKYMATAFAGDFDGTGYTHSYGTGNPTQRQAIAALILWDACKEYFGWPDTKLFGHYHFGKPLCPGYKLSEFINEINPRPDFG